MVLNAVVDSFFPESEKRVGLKGLKVIVPAALWSEDTAVNVSGRRLTITTD